jgi:hypothetical protein
MIVFTAFKDLTASVHTAEDGRTLPALKVEGNIGLSVFIQASLLLSDGFSKLVTKYRILNQSSRMQSQSVSRYIVTVQDTQTVSY